MTGKRPFIPLAGPVVTGKEKSAKASVWLGRNAPKPTAQADQKAPVQAAPDRRCSCPADLVRLSRLNQLLVAELLKLR